MSATQFRLAGVGLSELTFIILMIALIVDSKNLLNLNKSLLTFSIFFASVLLAGLLTNSIIEKSILGDYRDVFALMYSIFGSFVIISSGRFNIDHVIYGSYLSIQFLFAGFVLSLLATGLPIPIDFWYGGGEDLTSLADVGRFKGWSENPNQLGLFLIAAFYYNFYISNLRFNFKLFYSIPLAIILILVNSSATIMSVFVLMLVPYMLDLNLKWRSSVVLWLFKISFYFGVLILFMFGAFQFFNKTGDFDGNGRLPLWWNSILAVYESPVWGWGPGGHAGYSAPFEGWESHNIYLDIATQSGFLGLFSFLLLIGLLLVNLWRLGMHKQVGLVVSFLVYGFSHYMLRIPLFWIVLFALFVSSNSAALVRPRNVVHSKFID
ncbi:MAG: O-antigen ligase family protein [Pseudomonadota bacterium]